MSSLPGVAKAEAEELLKGHTAGGEGHVVASADEHRADRVLDEDPDLASAENLPLKNFLLQQRTGTVWSRIS